MIISHAHTKDRVHQAFNVILDFYGMEGESPDFKRRDGWEERYKYLNDHHKNFDDITNVILTLGIFGHAPAQQAFIEFLSNEVFTEKLLHADKECVQHWIPQITCEDQRAKILKIVPDKLKGLKTDRDLIDDEGKPKKAGGLFSCCSS